MFLSYKETNKNEQREQQENQTKNDEEKSFLEDKILEEMKNSSSAKRMSYIHVKVMIADGGLLEAFFFLKGGSLDASAPASSEYVFNWETSMLAASLLFPQNWIGYTNMKTKKQNKT